jgi:hypothetical protein
MMFRSVMMCVVACVSLCFVCSGVVFCLFQCSVLAITFFRIAWGRGPSCSSCLGPRAVAVELTGHGPSPPSLWPRALCLFATGLTTTTTPTTTHNNKKQHTRYYVFFYLLPCTHIYIYTRAAAGDVGGCGPRHPRPYAMVAQGYYLETALV